MEEAEMRVKGKMKKKRKTMLYQFENYSLEILIQIFVPLGFEVIDFRYQLSYRLSSLEWAVNHAEIYVVRGTFVSCCENGCRVDTSGTSS